MRSQTHNVGKSIDQVRDGTIQWEFKGDRLVCHVGARWTRLSEYGTRKGKRRLLFRQEVPSEMAVKIAEEFDGKVVWK